MDYRHCTLCPRRCGVDRTEGSLGFCRMQNGLRRGTCDFREFWDRCGVFLGMHAALRFLSESGNQ